MDHASISFAHGFQGVKEQLEYISGAIAHLEAICGRRLNQEEARSWMEKLKKYPKWKLTELGEYSGPMNYRVFEYLDALNRPDDPRISLGYDKDLKQLEHNPSKEISHDVRKHIDKMLLYVGNGPMNPEQLREKRLVEKAGLEELHRKYPYNGFDSILKESRFEKL